MRVRPHGQPATGVEAGGAPGQRGASGQVHPHVAADRHAGPGVRRPQVAGPALPRVVLLAQPGQEREQQRRPVRGVARRQRERGGRRHRQLLGRGADVEPDPEHGGRAGRGVDALDEDPRDLEVPDQHVVGPLHAGVEARVAQRRPHGVPGEQRQPRPLLRSHGRPEQHGERQRRPRRGLPAAVQPAAAGGLVLGHDHESLRGALAGAGRDEGVGGGGGVDDLHGEAGSGVGEAIPVEGRACARVIGHGHYIGRRHPRRPHT